jgi:hypothetical protein
MSASRAAARLALWEADPSWRRARREAFVAYRDMSERTFARVARELRKSGSLVRRWASEDGWEERVEPGTPSVTAGAEEFLEHGVYVAREQAEDAARLREALIAPARVVVERLERARSEGGDSFEGPDIWRRCCA